MALVLSVVGGKVSYRPVSADRIGSFQLCLRTYKAISLRCKVLCYLTQECPGLDRILDATAVRTASEEGLDEGCLVMVWAVP